MTIRKIQNLVLLSLLLAAPGVLAETLDCKPITSLPAVIKYQGIYCFTGNLTTSMTSGNAIEIQTNNVTIDMNGWKLGGLAAGLGTETNGIYAYQRKNITIRNGTIRGFKLGIWLSESTLGATSQGHLIEDIRADKNTFQGIRVQGRGSTMRRNQVIDTGGSTSTSSAYGMVLIGPGGRVLNNDISGTAATAISYGLVLSGADGAVVENNRIDDVSADVPNKGFGLYFSGSNDVLVAGNRITRADFGIYYIGGSTGKYMDNLTSSVATRFTGGTSVGTNN